MELNSGALRRDVVVVGASAGGLEPMYALLAGIPVGIQAILAVVIHRGAFGGASMLAEVLARRTGHPFVEPHEPVAAVPGVVYLAPRDQHMVFDRGQIRAVRGAKEHFTRPAVDPLFASAADCFGGHVVGVLLSGAGSDGVRGMIRIKQVGGLSLVQRPDEATHPSMPVSAIEGDHVDAAFSVEELARVIPELVAGRQISTNGAAGESQGWRVAARSTADRRVSR